MYYYCTKEYKSCNVAGRKTYLFVLVCHPSKEKIELDFDYCGQKY
jgi:hypothetical protein